MLIGIAAAWMWRACTAVRRWGLLVLGAVVATAAPALAQTAPMVPAITVVGEASVDVSPDHAQVRAGVTSQGQTARAASEANNKAMAGVMAALKEAGIAERDIQTTRLSLSPVYEQNQPRSSRITGFQAANQVTIKVRDMARVTDVVDRVIAAGANTLGGINFLVTDVSKVLDKVRADAIADAHRKAELYAKAAGVGLGRALAIAEEGTTPPVPITMRAAPMAAPQTPVSPGEKTLRISVAVTYELMR